MGQEQRAEDRYDVQVVAGLSSEIEAPRPISLTNVSRNGCRFVGDRGLRFGTRITIVAGRSGQFTARVRWRFGRTHGVRFDEPLPEPVFDHIRLFLSQHPALVAECREGPLTA